MKGLAVLLLLGASARAQSPILGFNLPVWSARGYASPEALRGLDEAAATGASWVALTPTLYVKDRRDAEIRATASTPDDDSLRAAIRHAHGLGLKAALKPHVDRLDGGVRAWIDPKDPARWFAAYRVHLLHYARLAREERCELFVVGTELSLLSAPTHAQAWRGLIRAARAEYPGPLTYAANWHSVALAAFWKDLDYIGVDAYYPVPGGTNRTLLKLGWLPRVAELKALSAAYGRPVLFTEFGLASQKGANLRPWEWKDFGPADPKTQAAYIETFLGAFSSKPWVVGFLDWAWDLDPSHQGLSDKSMALKGKPALVVFQSLFRSARREAPSAPDHAASARKALSVLGVQ